MAKRRKEAKKEKPNYAFIIFTIFIFVSAVAAYGFLSGGSPGSRAKSSVSLPDYAHYSQKTFDTYTIATKIPEVLEKLPCYCGCKNVRDEQFPEGHKNLLHCYMDDKGKFTDHAVYCDLCMDEALDAYRWYTDGLSIKEIRQRIDEKYGNGRFGPGTDTPPV